MKYAMKWTLTAKNDLSEIIEHIAVDSVSNAREQLKKIQARAEEIKDFPEKGRVVPELNQENITRYREAIITPWRIIYRIEDNIVYALAVIDGRRNIEDILLKRQLR